MKKAVILLFLVSIVFYACTKEQVSTDSNTLPPKNTVIKAYSAANIYNPIVGKWEIGKCIIICGTDTTVYQNEVGDIADFQKNDTIVYTFFSMNSSGFGPYEIIDSTTFVLGDTMHITSFDGIRITTHWRSVDGRAENWRVYKKYN